MRPPRHLVAVAAMAGLFAAAPARAQAPNPREAAERLRFPPLRFQPVQPRLARIAGVPVFFLEDRAVPLVNLMARFEGGYSRFPRAYFAAGVAMPALLRYGGTPGLAPDSVDKVLEYYALQTTFGGGGESTFSSLNTLTEYLPQAVELWSALLRSPGFDSTELEVWRGRELDAVRRRPDDPQRLAFSEFNRLMYGNHPVGWEMEEADLAPDALTGEKLAHLHRRIVCRENLSLGVTGDVSWDEIRSLLEPVLEAWPACVEPLAETPAPSIRDQGGVFVIPRPLEQSILVLAHATDLNLGDPDYFSAQIGNTILGGGGFSSRLLSRVRTEEGYAYSAASLWTMPRRHQGLVGAVTRTRPENAVPALRLILEILESVREDLPTEDEVDTSVDQIANGYVFNFETAAQVVSRRMSFMAQELPDDWLERYLEGIQGVTRQAVRSVFRRHLHPESMVILVVGDPARMDMEGLATLGPVTFLDVRGVPTEPPGAPGGR